jgi:cation/acetate symporter
LGEEVGKHQILTFEDKDGNGRIELKPDKKNQRNVIDPDIIVLSTPEVAKLAPW